MKLKNHDDKLLMRGLFIDNGNTYGVIIYKVQTGYDLKKLKAMSDNTIYIKDNCLSHVVSKNHLNGKNTKIRKIHILKIENQFLIGHSY